MIHLVKIRIHPCMYLCVGAVQTEEGAVANDMPEDTWNYENP